MKLNESEAEGFLVIDSCLDGMRSNPHYSRVLIILT